MAAVITVSTLSGLYDALAHATGGETIQLASGNYGNLSLGTSTGHNGTFPTNVTITSADPLHPATFSGFALNGVSNLTLDGVVCDYTFKTGDPDYTAPFSINGGDHITIKNSTFDGDVAKGTATAADGFATGIALSVTGTQNLVIQGNEISNFYRGLIVSETTNATISGNDVHAIRSDGMDFIQVHGVTIEANHIHDFLTSPNSGDHPDMIQFWTAGTTQPSTDIVIRGNLLDSGNGTWTQSIFMRNEMVDQGLAGQAMYYRNVTIEQNVIVNGHLHGITVGETAGLVIRQNSVLHTDGNAPDGADSAVEIPTINLAATSTGVSVTGNLTSSITGWTGQTGWVVSQNAFVQDQNALAPGYYGDVFVSSSLTAHDGVHMFLALPGSMIDQLGAGAAVTRDYLPAAGAVAALFQASDIAGGSLQTKIFDAGLSLTHLGTLPSDTVFEWSFGDGTTAVGQKVTHSFATGGHYDVALTVRLSTGATNTVHGTIGVQNRDILTLGSDGLFHAYDYENTVLLPTSPFASSAGIQLGGTGVAATIDSSRVAALLGVQDFDIALRLDADRTTSTGEVFRLHGSVMASVTDTGELLVQAYNTQMKQIQLTSAGILMNDLKSHDIDIQLHDGSLQLWVDGKMTSSAAFVGTLNTFGPTDLTFGNPWGAKNFYGDVTQFDIKVGEIALANSSTTTTTVPPADTTTTTTVPPVDTTATAPPPVDTTMTAPGIHLGGHTIVESIAGSHLTTVLQAKDFDVGMRIDAASVGSYGQIFHLDRSITAGVDAKTGAFTVRALDNYGRQTNLATTGVAVNDAKDHDIDIRLHDGKLQIWVDGSVAAETAFKGTLHSNTRDLYFGNTSGTHVFDGYITHLDIDVGGVTPAALVQDLSTFGQPADLWGAIL